MFAIYITHGDQWVLHQVTKDEGLVNLIVLYHTKLGIRTKIETFHNSSLW